MRSRSRIAALAAGLLVWGATGAASRDEGADGEFAKRTSSHFALYQDVDIDESGGFRGSRRFEQQVLDELERAYQELDDRLGLRPPRRIAVVIYDPGVFDAQFAGLFRFSAAGFYHGVIRIRGATQLDVGLSRVLHHELVHAAFDAAAPSYPLPGWVNEGIAEWFEARAQGKRTISSMELAWLARARGQGGLLPVSALMPVGFGHLGPEAASVAYLQSYGMIDLLARRHGERSLREFCLELVRTRNLTRVLKRVYRTDVEALAAAFLAELG